MEDPEINKEQFLKIVQHAFKKITAALHPTITNSLNQIQFMYEHYITQVEENHNFELAELSQSIE